MRAFKIKIRNKLKQKLSIEQLAGLAKFFIFFKRLFWWPINLFRKLKLNKSSDLNIHLGCSEKLLSDYINVDVRVTTATDITTDLNKPKFRPGSVRCFYSNAFFEHLMRTNHIEHLSVVNKSLSDNGGFVCYTSIPYFKNIAKFYLNKSVSTNGPVFDIFTVYRYTHGDPDRMLKDGWYFEQLHKYLFDEEYISQILENSNFSNYIIFEHAFPHDQNKLPVNIGFYASKSKKSKDALLTDLYSFLRQFEKDYVDLNSIKILSEKSL